MPMPIMQTTTPPSVHCPDKVVSRLPNVPKYIGGISVPNAAQNPNAIAYPSDIPRYRIDRPNVSPPTPHRIPKRYVQKMLPPEDSLRTVISCGTVKNAISHGITIHENTPLTNQ